MLKSVSYLLLLKIVVLENTKLPHRMLFEYSDCVRKLRKQSLDESLSFPSANLFIVHHVSSSNHLIWRKHFCVFLLRHQPVTQSMERCWDLQKTLFRREKEYTRPIGNREHPINCWFIFSASENKQDGGFTESRNFELSPFHILCFREVPRWSTDLNNSKENRVEYISKTI